MKEVSLGGLDAEPFVLDAQGSKSSNSSKCAGAYIVLRLDPGKLTSEVKFEAAAPVGDKATSDFGGKKSEEQNFPHLYGAIDEAAVVTELGVQRQEDGTFTGIDGL